MRLSLSIHTWLICFASTALAETIVPPGFVSGEWTLADSPYFIEGDIEVRDNSALTVQAGVYAYFAPNARLTVWGQFRAEGQLGDSVYFVSASMEPEERWGGIYLPFAGGPPRSMSYTVIEAARGWQSPRAGLAVDGGEVILRHCSIRGTVGCGIRVENGARLEAEHLHVIANGGSVGCGAALNISHSEVRLSHSRIMDNYSSLDGGGFCTYQSSVFLDHCLISGNTAQLWGGGFWANDHTTLEARNCIFSHNGSILGGGISFDSDSPLTLTRCIFYRNTCDGEVGHGTGGALRIIGGAQTQRITHCVFMENLGTNIPGIQILGPTLVENCIFASNMGVSINCGPQTVDIQHCLFYPVEWFHFGGFRPEGILEMDSLNYNEDPCDRYGNLAADPMLADPLNLDFSLTSGSACIDAGAPVNQQESDRTPPDIGAIWFNQTPIVAREILPAIAVWKPASPNPFNPTTTLRFDLSASAHVSLHVIDLLGREVSKLLDEQLSAGEHSITWDASPFSSGTYFAVLNSGDEQIIQKLLLLK